MGPSASPQGKLKLRPIKANVFFAVYEDGIFFMALNKEQKENIVEKLKQSIAKQKAMVFVAIEGLKTTELFDLRKELKQDDCLLTVVKKTLLGMAFKQSKIELDVKELKGELALVFGFGDEIRPAKIAYQFSKKNKSLKILGGFFENEVKTAEEIIILARIPSREELLAKIVSSISSPISGFINVLQGNIKGLVYVLSAIKK